jgi:Zn-finger nucleic acid-binding protein
MLPVENLRSAIEELTGLAPTLSYRKEEAGKRTCPHCEAAMTTAKLTIELPDTKPVKPEPEIDRCATHGIWFDDTELAAVLEPVAGKGFGGGRANPKSALTGTSMGEPRPFNFKIGGRGWGM